MTYISIAVAIFAVVIWIIYSLRPAWIRANEMEAEAQAEHVKKMAKMEREHREKMKVARRDLMKEACQLSKRSGIPVDDLLLIHPKKPEEGDI